MWTTFFFISALWAGGLHDEVAFEKQTIDLGAAETCAVFDVNGDGKLDIVSGENWFEAPAWTRHRFRKLKYERFYIDAFSDLPVDVDGDGHVDLVTATWFARELAWYRNPGQGQGTWVKHVFDAGSPTEFAFLVDLDNDGKDREILPQFGPKSAAMAWFEVKGGQPVKHVVAPGSFGHGIGAGDVNGDGRNDILTPVGWWEAPNEPATGQWIHHEDFAQFEFPQLGFLFVRDLNGDGRNDVITSLAHGYGVLWLEQLAGGKWKKHIIDESWSQPHAMTLVDLNGDQRIDLVTGKRFHAHNGKDPGGHEPLGIYWYEHRPGADGELIWKRHVIDHGSRAGGGMQIPVVDLDGDGDLDILAPGKGGLYLFRNLTRR